MTANNLYLNVNTEKYLLLINEIIEVLNSSISENSSDNEILSEILYALKKREVSQSIDRDNKLEFRLSPQEFHWLEKHDRALWVDYLNYRYEFKLYPYTRKLLSHPLHLLIEPTSICNLRCTMCFQVDRTFTKKEYMGMMPWDLFVKIVDEAAEIGCNAITLASRGEPTLHKDFGKMLIYLKSKNILDIKINTNATKLTEELCHDILKAEVSEVVFSVDAGTKDTYESIRVKGKFEEVVANIEQFAKIREKYYPNAVTTTRISGVKVSKEQDIEQMETFWSRIVDEVVIVPAYSRWDTYNNPTNSLTTACSALWSRMYVWYDGTCNPCDFDYKSNLALGNVNDHSLAEIWANERYAKFRELHAAKNRSQMNPCDRCPLY